MLRDCYYLKIKKWINYWQKTKRRPTIIFEWYLINTLILFILFNTTNTKVKPCKIGTIHLEFRLWEVPLVPACTRRWCHDLKITAATGKAGVKRHCSVTTPSKLHLPCTPRASSTPGTGPSLAFPPQGTLVCQHGHVPWTSGTPDQHPLQCRSAEQTWPKLTATAKFLTLQSKQSVDDSISKPTENIWQLMLFLLFCAMQRWLQFVFKCLNEDECKTSSGHKPGGFLQFKADAN